MQVIYPELLELAQWRLDGTPGTDKAAFVPVDPAAAGAPPGDPAAAMAADPAAAAAGGQPPTDPAAAMGGAPPVDPMMAGGAPPAGGDPSMAGGGLPPELQMMVDQAVQTALQSQGATPGAAPGQPGAAGGTKKVDPALLYMELGRVRKLLTHLLQNIGLELPPDILDDGMVAQSVLLGGAAPKPLGTGAAGGAPGGMAPAGGGAAPTAKQALDFLFEPAANAGQLSRKVDILEILSRSRQ
jgi:hypothetical protein